MKTQFTRCLSDEDFSKVCLFIFEHKRDLHPSFSTLDTIPLLYSYLTQGYLIQGLDDTKRIIAASAYYHGTSEEEFQDKHVVLIDIAIVDRSMRGTRVFYRGLKYMVNYIIEQHPEVTELRFTALTENTQICKLYSKFSKSSYTREGTIGQETVFCEQVHRIKTTLTKFNLV